MGIDVLPGVALLIQTPLVAIGIWPIVWWLVKVAIDSAKGRDAYDA